MRSVHSAVRAATRPTSVLVGLVEDAFRSRKELIAENALLRQQLIVAARSTARGTSRRLASGLASSSEIVTTSSGVTSTALCTASAQGC